MEKRLVYIYIIILTGFFVNTAVAQAPQPSDGRYIKIDNFSLFFKEADGNMTTDEFQLYNIMEDESSKPVHVGVYEVINVVKFSIESGSTTYENQRRCKLTIKKDSYIDTFKRVLIKMNVKYVLCNGSFLSLEDFFNSIK
jgi:hypothetical protein